MMYILMSTKNGLGGILHDFFKNSSGHPGFDQFLSCFMAWKIIMYYVIKSHYMLLLIFKFLSIFVVSFLAWTSFQKLTEKLRVFFPNSVTRLGEFSPIGRLFTFGSFWKNYRSSTTNWVTFFKGNICMYRVTYTKIDWTTFWAIFTDASGHPVSQSHLNFEKNPPTVSARCYYWTCLWRLHK
jgi:hypothetical protein